MGKLLSITVECKACKATGIYSGMAEIDRCGVRCKSCKGTGHIELSGTEFTERQTRDDIDKVFHTSGFCVSDISRGGVDYDEFLDNADSPNEYGNEIRDYMCPYYCYQSIAYKVKAPLWKQCNELVTAGNYISSCEKFNEKHLCWEQLDRHVRDNNLGDNLWKIETESDA